MSTLKKWYSFTEKEAFNGNEPYFFNIENKPWKKTIEDNYAIFLIELQEVINKKNNNLVPYIGQTSVSNPNSWTIFELIRWGKKCNPNSEACPQTTKIIESIDGASSCLFSILKPHTKIKPHFGDSNVMYRCHLTLKCEGGLPEIGMRVGKENITWKNGKVFAFCDAHNHEVWNDTDYERWVLIIDVFREEFLGQKEKICAEINASLWWQRNFKKFYFINHLPKWSRRLLLKTTALFM